MHRVRAVKVRVSGVSTFRAIGLGRTAEIPLEVFCVPANPASSRPFVADVTVAPLTSAAIVSTYSVKSVDWYHGDLGGEASDMLFDSAAAISKTTGYDTRLS